MPTISLTNSIPVTLEVQRAGCIGSSKAYDENRLLEMEPDKRTTNREMSTAINFSETSSRLLDRLRHSSDRQAWQGFFDTYWILLYNFARKVGLDAHAAEDVVADTVTIVAQEIAEFDYDRNKGKFRSWLFTIVRNQSMTHLRKLKRTQEVNGLLQADSSAIENDDETGQFEVIWNDEWRQHIVEMALKELKKKVSASQYQIFHSHVMKGQSVKTVSASYGVSIAQIYVCKLRVGRIFKNCVRAMQDAE